TIQFSRSSFSHYLRRFGLLWPLADSIWGAPMIWWLSPAESFCGSVWVLASEWVLVAPSALRLPFAHVVPSELGSGTRFRSLFQFRQSRRKRFQIDYLIVKPNRLTAVD